MKLLYLRHENTHSDFILDASVIKAIVPVGRYQNASFMIYDENDETYEFDHIYHNDLLRWEMLLKIIFQRLETLTMEKLMQVKCRLVNWVLETLK